MSSPTLQTIVEVAHLYVIYGFLIVSVFGHIGNICNIIIFTNLKKFREYPSSFYIIAESIVNLGILLLGATVRALDEIFKFQSDLIILIWCKLRQPIIQWCTDMFLCLVNFAVIDQYLSTNFRPRLRQWSTVKLGKYLIAISAIAFFFYNILLGIFYDVRTKFGCAFTNVEMTRYYSYFHLLILQGIIPMSVAFIFSIWAYRNVRRIHRQQLSNTRRRMDQQFTAMILARVIVFILSLVLYVAQSFYTINSQHNAYQGLSAAIVALITYINVSLIYVNVASSFYAYLVASMRFRRQAKYILMKKCLQCCRWIPGKFHRSNMNNQVAPITNTVPDYMDE
ncbi:unnamed protein product [Rotaria magnacalcarata]|uniref:G-protein coupled receptors family 1 profile domain-containing protein n=1 Tax=Rotaria magnacalcarata TaxID=392030 RepID=A0A816GVU2_9BILA|nr:unnamed protein product [Rotaria magnacalcarata]CAF1678441.1 unnamed protein product [Rotaria magnacalcarata]CAF4094330.1 unnamed protein product [Rotaria magnacalcarata]CAF4146318.1 unnamed protein product [Rotaria magnacalcarata]